MRGEPQIPNLALLAGLQKQLLRASRGEDPFHVLQPGDGVVLVRIEVVCPQALEGTLQLATRPRRVPLLRLAGKENLLAVRLESRSQFEFGFAIAVRGRHIEIVHPQLDRLGYQPVGLLLFESHDHDAAETDDRELDLVPVATAGQIPGGRSPGAQRPRSRSHQKFTSPHVHQSSLLRLELP